jgi:hypothetical protein
MRYSGLGKKWNALPMHTSYSLRKQPQIPPSWLHRILILYIIIIIYSYTDSAEGHAVLLSVRYKETLLLERDKNRVCRSTASVLTRSL